MKKSRLKNYKSFKSFKHIAELIQKHRKLMDIALKDAGGLNQTDLSNKIGGTSGQYVSNIERGECGLSAKHVKKVAMILGIAPSDIINAATKDFKESYEGEVSRHEVKIS